jgi:hypothetical protein
MQVPENCDFLAILPLRHGDKGPIARPQRLSRIPIESLPQKILAKIERILAKILHPLNLNFQPKGEMAVRQGLMSIFVFGPFFHRKGGRSLSRAFFVAVFDQKC